MLEDALAESDRLLLDFGKSGELSGRRPPTAFCPLVKVKKYDAIVSPRRNVRDD